MDQGADQRQSDRAARRSLGRFRDVFRQHLMDVTHGTGWHAYERTIDAQISRLSKKEDDLKHPKLIKSVHGDGYVFTASVSKFVAARK